MMTLAHSRFSAPALAAGALLFACALGGPAGAADWPHWRGPAHDGTSPETGLPVEWSEERGVAWSVALPGVSAATPIVAGGRVFLLVGADQRLELWALSAGDGTVLWKRPLGSGNRVTRKHDMSSPSPVTDGEKVWVLTGTGVLAGFGPDGRELWRRELQREFGAFGLNWGYASSPVLADGTVFVAVLHGMRTDDPSYLLAVEGGSGKTLWRVERPTDARVEAPDAYTTPLLLRRAGGSELVVSGADYVTGHDPASGAERWRVGGLNPGRDPMYRVVASPVAVGEWLFVPSRVSPLQALRVPAKGPPRLAWSTRQGPDVPTPVSDGKVLYVVDDRGLLRRFEVPSGDELGTPLRLGQGNQSASPVLADGKLYVLNERGVTTVVEVAGEPRILAHNSLPGFALASPAIADGRIFLRTAERLFCVGAPAPASAGR